MRPAVTVLVLLLACGKPPGLSGGFNVEVNYTLLGGSTGCVMLRAAPLEGVTRETTKSLDGLPRMGMLEFGVARSADWTSAEVTLFASLHETTCSGAVVARDSRTRNFPDRAVETVVLAVAQTRDAGGGSGGGTAGGATAGGSSAGGATAGGATAGGATAGGGRAGGGTAGGGRAGGGTAGGATAGGATAGGATAGGATAGGATAGGAPMPVGCGGGFITVATALSGTNHDVAVVGPDNVWVVGGGQPRLARVIDGGSTSPGSGACQNDLYSAWARDNGRVYAGADAVLYRLDDTGGSCVQVDTISSGLIRGVWGTPEGGTQQRVFFVTQSGRVGYFGDGVAFNRTDELIADDLQAIDGFSATSVFAAGAAGGSSKGEIFYFDGGTWASSYSDNSNSTTFFAMSFVSPNLGWAAGDKGTLMQWNGTSWSAAMALPSGFSVVRGIKAFSASAIYVVGNTDRIMRWNGASWVQVGTASPPGIQLEQIRGTSECDLWVVGASGYVGTTNR